jgi:hypothetical protein
MQVWLRPELQGRGAEVPDEPSELAQGCRNGRNDTSYGGHQLHLGRFDGSAAYPSPGIEARLACRSFSGDP